MSGQDKRFAARHISTAQTIFSKKHQDSAKRFYIYVYTHMIDRCVCVCVCVYFAFVIPATHDCCVPVLRGELQRSFLWQAGEGVPNLI